MKNKKSKKEKTGEAFEKLVLTVEAALTKNSTKKITHNKIILDNAKIKNQIDIVLEDATGTTRTIIECKEKGRPVQLSEMKVFVETCKSTGSNGIFVSKSGFQKGAQQKALSENINMMILKKLSDVEISKLKIPKTSSLINNLTFLNVQFIMDEKYKNFFGLKPDDEFLYFKHKKEIAFTFPQKTINDNCNFYFSMLLLMLQDKKYQLNEEFKIKEFLEYEEEMFLKIQNQLIPLSGFSIDFNLKISEGLEIPKQIYQYTDLNNTVIANVMTIPQNKNGEKYTLSFIDGFDSFKTFLIPNFRSSDIKKLSIHY